MLETVQTLLGSLAISFDFPILTWIQANLQSPVMDKAMPIVTLFGDKGVFWISIAVMLLFSRKTRKIGWSMGVALALGLLVCNGIMKPLVARIRPYTLYAQTYGETIKLLVKAPTDFSFPSGHTIASFEACTVLLIKNKWAGIAATLLAFGIAFSRVYLFVHYPTDVIFAAFAGILFGILGCLIVDLLYKRFPEKRGKYQRN